MTPSPIAPQTVLLADIKALIDGARQRVAVAVNAELSLLYWQVGSRIRQNILGNQRAEYGAAVVAGLSQQLTAAYGKGWGLRQLRQCLRFAEVFGDEGIVHTLCAQLSWSQLRLIAALDDPLKREFYTELCRLENWSVRQLQERIGSLLFERSAISRKPEATIAVYAFAGERRSVNAIKGDFMFAAAAQLPRLLAEYERDCLARYTPAPADDRALLVQAIAETHAELILIHPFIEGNGRIARLLADVMAVQAGYEPLDYSSWDAQRENYFAAIRAALDRDYVGLQRLVDAALGAA